MSDLEQKAQKLVEINVICNVSQLISELSECDKFQEEILDMSIAYDYEECVYQAIQNDELDIEKIEEDYNLDSSEHYKEICDDYNLDPEPKEVFEHWIITDSLARHLEEYGELVTYDFAGLTIWSRTTTGQAIYADYVIEQIAKNMM